MTLRVEFFSPAIKNSRFLVYESGVRENYMTNRNIKPFSRKIDLYGGDRSIAVGGYWNLELYDPQGFFSETGIFSPDLRSVVATVTLGERVVFVGRAEKINHKSKDGGLLTSIQLRDIVDDLVAQRVEGIVTDAVEEEVFVAQTFLSFYSGTIWNSNRS